jgi:hypothetical protein
VKLRINASICCSSLPLVEGVGAFDVEAAGAGVVFVASEACVEALSPLPPHAAARRLSAANALASSPSRCLFVGHPRV